MNSDRQDEYNSATHDSDEEKARTEPRARGTPGSFDQPTPRDEVMPRGGGRRTYQTAEVPLGTGEFSEPPGGSGYPASRVKKTHGQSPSDPEAPAAQRSAAETDEGHAEGPNQKEVPE